MTVDLSVPAEAEFVLEGYVDPEELRIEGPFGDHTGYYSLADLYPVFHVTAITHRRNPVYHATLVGKPPMEDCYLAKATERMFLPMLQTVFPEGRGLLAPLGGGVPQHRGGRHRQGVSGARPEDHERVMGQGQMSFCKAIAVMDRSVDLTDPNHVIEALLTRLDVTTDITLTKGVLDVLDHSSPFPNFGNKIGLDLTERFPGEPPRNPFKFSGRAAGSEGEWSGDELGQRAPSEIPGVAAARHLFPERSQAPGGENRILALSVEKTAGRGGAALAAMILGPARTGGIQYFCSV